MVSETWLTNEDDISIFQLEGYKMVNNYRAQKRGGGVCIYVSNHLRFRFISNLTLMKNDIIESITIELKMQLLHVFTGPQEAI